MNTLAERLKYAKRELTALKTAHRRGVGLLKVYHYEYELDLPTGEVSFYILTVNVTFSSTAYPFLQHYMVVSNIYYNPFSANEEVFYQNNGWGAQFDGTYLIASHYTLALDCTSPITSMTYSWREA